MTKKVGIPQQALSRLENPAYGKATLTTLKRIAAACDVALLVEFVPFSQLINRATGTPYKETGLSPETMDIPNFDKEFGAKNLGEEVEEDENAEQLGGLERSFENETDAMIIDNSILFESPQPSSSQNEIGV